MRVLSALAVSAALTCLVVAPATAQPFRIYEAVDTIRAQELPADNFAHSLAGEYRRFALSEADDMVDWIDAEHFALKTLAASRGEEVAPENLDEWKLSEAHLPALASSRDRLLRAYARDSRIIAPHASARAQAQFDCWVEQAEEGHQDAHIKACRDGFLDAMLEVDRTLAIHELNRIEAEYPPK